MASSTRSRFCALLLALLLGGVVGAPSAWAARPRVLVSELAPTQMEIGKKAAAVRVQSWRDQAQAKGMSLGDYAARVLRPKFARLRLPTVIDPSGTMRNTDGHHRVTALLEVSRLTGVQFEITPNVLADYRGKSWKAYAKDFIGRLNKGQFTAEVETLPMVERVRELPETFAGLRNNPMRSALEVVFERNGISGSLMNNYVEFRVARRLLERGLLDKLKEEGLITPRARTLPAELATDPQVLDIVERALGKKPMRHYLLSEARNGKARRELKAILRKL